MKRRGFTLIELMVSVTLAVIILGMFALLYKWCTETYSMQRGNRRNDQRSRQLSIILRADIKARSFRKVVPFVPGQTTPGLPDRRGYFSISENDPGNGTDDVLAFTVVTPSGQMPYSGRTVVLRAAGDMTDAGTYLRANVNQPEFDDGNISRNGVGSSRAIEVAYFMRHGRLYRRRLLIREPYDDEGTGAQPDEITGDYSVNVTAGGSGLFWRDFDYSAYHKSNGTNTGVKFHSIADSLRNANPPAKIDDDFGFPRFSLGIPPLRFGYSLNRPASVQLLPREYDSSTPPKWIGRFLIHETAHSRFGYPGVGSNDPHIQNITASNGVVPAYNSTFRRSEDVIMENVHEFDVKVWDDPIQKFVDLGHSETDGNGNPAGFYHRSKNMRSTTDTTWNRFDTWHPFKRGDGENPLGNPPFKAGGTNAGLDTPEERPLRAIQITIRFYDVPTKKMRQVTIVETLTP